MELKSNGPVEHFTLQSLAAQLARVVLLSDGCSGVDSPDAREAAAAFCSDMAARGVRFALIAEAFE